MSKRFVSAAEFTGSDVLNNSSATSPQKYDSFVHTLAAARFVEAEREYRKAMGTYPDGHPERLGAEALFGAAQVALALAQLNAPLEGDPVLETQPLNQNPLPVANRIK